ncbi:sterol desaturase family protein [Sulfuricurvum sp.]|uniref:sterol desaturase family protein n=1 Tax=Sulfuricurvum sp. TaxID=2025608 RepID=UPI00262C6241|nr:sterol desaturase family protein [Sulfuricurvum sp.]
MPTVIEMTPWDYFFDPSKRLYWLYLASSALIAAVFLLRKPKMLSHAFSAMIWWHPSARLDYGYFIVSLLFKTLLIFPLVISAEEVTRIVYTFLASYLGYVDIDMGYESVMVLYTLSLFLFSDFTRYWLHRWLHTVPFLWRFHRVHHSARVLNPFTFYRVHPIENLLFGFRYALSAGVVSGIFIFLFGSLEMIDLLGVNAFIVAFLALGSNLRHSHVALGFPKRIEKWVSSPAQHQLHHAQNTMNKNYGGALSLWDTLFGTLALSADTKRSRFGLRREQMEAYRTIWGLLSKPFIPRKIS